MGFFKTYKYAWVKDDIVYYEHRAGDEMAYYMNLYFNEKLVDSAEGMLGEFILEHEGIEVKVKNTALKSTHHLFVNGDATKFEEVKLKRLKEILSSKQYHNALNPTKEDVEAARFKFSEILIPVLLTFLALVVSYFTKDMPRKTSAIAYLIPCAVAGWMFFNVICNYFPSFGNIRKAFVGMIALVFALVTVISEMLF